MVQNSPMICALHIYTIHVNEGSLVIAAVAFVVSYTS